MRLPFVATRYVLGALLAVLPASLLSLWAAEFWEQKSFLQWSEKECNRLLTRSPWASSNSFRRTANIGSSLTGERETTEIIYVRALTAKPIRMALARLQLLEREIDEATRRQVEDYVNAPPGDRIMLQISYRSVPGTTPYLHDLHRFFGQATTASFHGNTVLSADQTTVPIEEYLPWTPNRPNPILVLPRFDEDGQPYFTGRENSISLRSDFDLPLPDGRREYRIFVRMRPKDMIFQNEFVF